MTAWGLTFIAGLLATLSPCILPVLPLVIGSGIQKNKMAPLWMSVGMIFSFTILGVGILWIQDTFSGSDIPFRSISAILLIAIGLMLTVPILDTYWKKILQPLSNMANRLSTRIENQQNASSSIQFIMIGALLGLIWAPCTGPQLGVAISLALQEQAWLSSMAMFFFYGLGAALPLMIFAYGLQTVIQKNTGLLAKLAGHSKKLMGALLLIFGLMILFGWDKAIEIYFLNHAPESWIRWTTSY